MSDQEQVPEEDLEGGSAPETFPARSESDTFPARSESGSVPAPSEPQSVPAPSEPEPAAEPIQAAPGQARAANMLPGRQTRRSGLERAVVRTVATGGVVGIGVAVAAILGANHVQAWITGLVVSALSVVLAAILWSSERL